MPRKRIRAKVSVFEAHKPETHRIPAIMIHHNKGRLGQRSDSVNVTRESRITSSPQPSTTRDVDMVALEAAIAEDSDAHDFEIPTSVDAEDDPPTEVTAKVSCVPLRSNLY